jgi:hypothetical protein
VNRRSILSALAAVFVATPALADRIEVASKSLGSFSMLPLVNRFGPFAWRGGLELTSPDKRFGGFSSLALSRDGSKLLAVSDRGYWLRARLAYEADYLIALTGAELAPILDAAGKLVKGKARNDAEALAAWEPGKIDGRVIVGFETRTRAGTYDLGARGLAAPFTDIPLPPAIAKGPGNKELESLVRLSAGPLKGRVIAISEENLDGNGDIRGWVLGNSPFAFAIERHEDFAITDAAALANGDLLTVERSFAPGELPGMAMRRIAAAAIAPNARVTPHLLLQARAPFSAVDNMEGVAVSQTKGETRVTLISDDNYNHALQRTLLLQFALIG